MWRVLSVLLSFVAGGFSAPAGKDVDALLSGISMEDEAMKHINILDFMGQWAGNQTELSEMNKRFVSAVPFPHVEIPKFFSDEIADRILEKFPYD